jgi:hypothetical protein
MDKIKLPLLYDYVLPATPMANAIQTELSLVTYLFSQNSLTTKTPGIGFFEQQFPSNNDKDTPLTYLFGETYGSWPNTATGSHLSAGPLWDLVEVEEDSVYFGKKRHGKYIYPIKASPHLDAFAGAPFNGTKIAGNYFWKYISAEALEDIRSGRAIILIDYAQENFVPYQTFKNLHTAISYSDIPKEQIILAFNTFNAEEVYNTWFTKEDQRLTVKSWPFVISNTSFFYTQTREGRTAPEQFLASKNTLRDHYFLFKVRRPRENRQALTYALNQDGLLDLGDWSWLSDLPYQSHYVHQFNTYYGLNLTEEKLQELFNRLPKPLKDEPKDTFGSVSSWTDTQVKSYNNAYFYICTETYTEGPYKSVTEKICKPIANYLPFVFSSFPGALALLRSMGFRTFEPYIDESYDKELDGARRVKMIYEEVKKLCSMSKQELHDWYWSLEEILIHNREHLLTLYKTDKTTENFIKYLHQRITQ